MGNKKGIPPGTRESFGKEIYRELYVLDIIKSVYERFGFNPLRTPILEHADTFDGHHGEGEDLFFKLDDSNGNKLMLRYDLTVPFARYISDHSKLTMPFKRYQVATVFRDDKVDKGHFREFTQCDGDVVGIHHLIADAEIIAMAYTGLNELGFDNFVININHRKIITAISEKAGFSDRSGRLKIQRSLDAVSKFSEKWKHHGDEAYQKMFSDEIAKILSNYQLTEEAINVIQYLFTLSGSFDQKIAKLKDFLKNFKDALIGIKDLEEIVSYLDSEVKNKINLDLSLARGADYYTGFILEGSIPNVSLGAVLGGGRYDNLVKNLGGPDIPAVGMAFGFERIMVALEELKIMHDINIPEKVIVVPRSEGEIRKLLNFVKQLRQKGVYTDIVPMFASKYDEIETYAKKRGFNQLIIIEKNQCNKKHLIF